MIMRRSTTFGFKPILTITPDPMSKVQFKYPLNLLRAKLSKFNSQRKYHRSGRGGVP
jgi:hypothetical protein